MKLPKAIAIWTMFSSVAASCGGGVSGGGGATGTGGRKTGSGGEAGTGGVFGTGGRVGAGGSSSTGGSGATTVASGGATSTGGSSGTAGNGGVATQVGGGYFPSGAAWTEDVSAAAVAPDSAAITSWMVGFSAPNGFGGGGKIRVDFSIIAIDVPAGTAKRAYQAAPDFHYDPDCDLAPVPVPAGGVVELTDGMDPSFASAFSGYNCSGFDNGDDCHMLFVARSENRLYEIYHGTIDATDTFRAGCLAIWDTSKVYDKSGRGQQCTSADAAGFPIAPLLFTAEEIQAGAINHAIRFILPNNMIRAKKYVAPATHGTNTSGPATAIPYGGHMRLKSSFSLGGLSPAAQVVARALQKYGMYMADGGNIALTAQSDALGPVKWSDVGFDSNSLSSLKATDFEVIDHGATIDVTNDCQRTQISQ
jgi:serine/threonine-protein kinase